MGKKPSAPIYSQKAAIEEQNRINQAVANQTYADVNSPLGGYSVYVDPKTGEMTINKQLSNTSNAAMRIQGNLLRNYIADPNSAANAYYERQMRYVEPTFANQISGAQDSLTNRGIQSNSTAWNSVLDNIYGAQDRANTMMTNNALFNGQTYQGNLANQAAMAGAQVYDPALIAGQQGAGLSDTYDKEYQNRIAQYKTKLANSNTWGNILGTGGAISGGVIGGIYGGPMGAKMGAEAGGSAGTGWGGVIDNY